VLTATVKSDLMGKCVARVFEIMTKYKYKGINRYLTTECYLTLSPAGREKLH